MKNKKKKKGGSFPKDHPINEYTKRKFGNAPNPNKKSKPQVPGVRQYLKSGGKVKSKYNGFDIQPS